ncbi:hypothetical protein T4D_9543 [Trichinella pseudospiralis]|uniref:Uncharacterized protein n=1 Tax=Trichinella pseudospiralis TaxID=6337 RepID=A0A0V1F988_TRIPS|nr:hypothetical protein T4D_9543 [Trichinella pseudospiralis]
MSSLIKVRHTKICCSASISIPRHTCCFKVYKFDAFSKEGRFVYLKPLQKVPANDQRLNEIIEFYTRNRVKKELLYFRLPFQMSVDKLITTFCTNSGRI